MTQQTSDREFLDRLDAAIGCMHCEKPLPENAVSDYFCRQECSDAFAAARSPHRRTYDYFEDVDESGHEWSTEDLIDLDPVSWIRPPVWRLPRSTGDLEADRAALHRAMELAQTEAQQAACALRHEDINRRQRVIWAREWRLPRATGDFWKDNRACNLASATATTPAQFAACELRRLEIQKYKPLSRPPPGWMPRFPPCGPDLDPTSPTYVHGPYGRGLHSWDFDLTSSPIVHSRISWPVIDDYDLESFGSRAQNSLPGIRPATMRLSGVYEPANNRVALTVTPPRTLTYELRRDSDDTLLMTHVCPYREGVTWLWDLPHLNLNGTHMRVLDGDREIARHPIIDSRTTVTSPDLGTFSVHELTAEEMAEYRPLGEWTVQGAEATHAVIDEINPPARALEARRNRNTGPAPRPGRIRGNVPGARS